MSVVLTVIRKGQKLIAEQIAESLRRFGITDETSDLLAIKVGTTPDISSQTVSKHLEDHVKGQRVGFSNSEIAQTRDLARLRKIYKFDLPKNAAVPASGASVTGQDVLSPVISFVLGTMALKGS